MSVKNKTMIDWNKTHKKYGHKSLSEAGYRPTVVVICDKCGREGTKKVRKKDYDGKWECRKCINRRPDKIKKIKESLKELWQDPEYRKRNLSAVRSESNRAKLRSNWQKYMPSILRTEEYKKKLSQSVKAKWKDKAFKKAITESSKQIWNDKKLRKQMLESRRTPEYRQNQREKALQRWKDPDYISKQTSVKAQATRTPERLAEIKALQPKVSSLQEILYSILDDLGVKYCRERNDGPDDPECKIGPYSFDCVIPQEDRMLLIEVQGEYYHSRKATVVQDQQKASYIQNNFPRLELKYIWEHEFLNKNKIIELLKYWLGITKTELMDFSFKDVKIDDAPASDYKLLLSKYHYLSNAGRGGIAYGAYLNDKLIAVCVFSPLPRQNMPYSNKDARELSRLCIHPKYQKKNFASWFVSRCIKRLNSKYHQIISFCDTTYSHDGATYKACGFELDGEVAPDYWYVSKDGWAMHKKTLYNQAVKMKMKEKEYAEKNEYKKVFGRKKLRFLYNR